jgi:hypothetical protein
LRIDPHGRFAVPTLDALRDRWNPAAGHGGRDERSGRADVPSSLRVLPGAGCCRLVGNGDGACVPWKTIGAGIARGIRHLVVLTVVCWRLVGLLNGVHLFLLDGPDPVRDAPSVAGTADGPSQRLHRSMALSTRAHLATMHLLPACIAQVWTCGRWRNLQSFPSARGMASLLTALLKSQNSSSLQTTPSIQPEPGYREAESCCCSCCRRANTGRSRIATLAALLVGLRLGSGKIFASKEPDRLSHTKPHRPSTLIF